MKLRILSVSIVLFLIQVSLFSQASFGEAIKINENWQFKNRDYEDEFRKKPDPWRTVDLPHDWSVEGPHSPTLSSCTGYLPGGIGWYKKSLTIPASDKGKKIYIYFGGVYCNSEVRINDKLLGIRPNGYISFIYDMTPYVNFGAENQITVKVDHSKYSDSRWYTGSGIYRDVYLIKANPVHIDPWGVYCYADKVTAKQATVHTETTVNNSTETPVTAVVELSLTKKGEEKVIARTKKSIQIQASSTAKAIAELKISSPALWSIRNPNLYELHTSVSVQGKEVDRNTLQTGIRDIRFDANKGFFLNGENMKLKGVCIHHDAGCLGSAMYKSVWERRLKNLKDLGCNAIRMSHNPQDNMIYDICDEIGLLVMDEAFDEWENYKRKWIEGWNVGVPKYEGYAEYFKEWGERDLTDMVNQHKNHPSIIMWSIGNEVDYPNDPYSHPILDTEGISQKAVMGYKPNQPNAERLGVIAKKLVACVKKADTSRPVTAALAGVVMSNHTDYPFVIDVAGYNYTESRYKQDHEKYPERILYGSENRHDLDAWKAVTENDYIAGQFLWTGINYLGESHAWPSRGFDSGLLDFGGFKKPKGYYRESLWSDKPMVYIGARVEKGNEKKKNLMDVLPEWNFKKDEEMRIVCFTNCEKVELQLNGRTIAKQPVDDEDSGAKCWIIPFEAGTLKAVAFNKNQPVAEYSIQTSGQPEKIVCKPDVQSLSKKGDLAQIEVILEDKNGVFAFPSDNMITCKIKGPAKLLGMENSNPTDMVDYHDKQLRVYHGRLLAYVQATGDGGNIEVEFSGQWLKAAKVVFK